MPKEIATIAEIPMSCKSCGWSGGQDKCSACPPEKYVADKLTAQCPKCSGVAVQTEDCTYKFKNHH